MPNNRYGLPPSIARVIDGFAALPGVGPKTASRLTYYLLRSPDAISQNLAEALAELKEKTRFCSRCFNITESDVCDICTNSRRDAAVVMVVEEPLDLVAVEKSGSYHGRYHVLHGAIRPIDGIGPDDLKIGELVERVAKEPIVEVIIATNPSTEGEATAYALQRALASTNIKVTRLARGLPTGGDIEYVDSLTLRRALEGRSEF